MTDSLDFVIIGAGPAGLQLGYYLEQAQANYRILEASSSAGSFWQIETSEILAQLRTATRICLPPAFRQQNLGESAREARRRFEDCERSREPSRSAD